MNGTDTRPTHGTGIPRVSLVGIRYVAKSRKAAHAGQLAKAKAKRRNKK